MCVCLLNGPSLSFSWVSMNVAAKKVCQCFTTKGIKGVKLSPPSNLDPDNTDFYVYGNIQSCFPVCSSAVKSCQRCGGNKGFSCVENASSKRCCCVPPAQAILDKGRIAGCTKVGSRIGLEIEEAT